MNCKEFVRYVEEQVPSRLKTNEYLIFLNILKKRNLTCLEDLQGYLDRREEVLQDFITHRNTGPTMTDQLRARAEELGFIKHAKRNFLKYL